MADYYPLLARALDALPDRSPALRRAVYDRARSALIAQLRSLDPPVPEADIDLERQALDTAIGRLEAEYGTPPAAAAPPTIEPAPPEPPAPPAPEPVRPEPLAPGTLPPTLPEPEPPQNPDGPLVLPPASVPAGIGSSLGPAQAKPAIETVPFMPPPRRPRADEAAKTAPETSAPEAAASETGGGFIPPTPPPADTATEAGVETASPEGAGGETGNGRQRPRIDVVAPQEGRSRLLRNLFVGGVLAAVIALIAVAAFFLRDKPSDLQQSATEQELPAEQPDAKFSDRVGSERSETEARPKPAAPGAAPAQPEVTVSQRGILYEENQSDPRAQPIATNGHAVWRVEAVNGAQGEPLQTVLRANVEFPDAGLTLAMTMRRNLDPTLPASHTIELAFTNSGEAGVKRAVQNIGLLQLKDEEAARGSPVSGLPVRVRDNLFLIGLSSLKSDVDRNTDLMLHKNWFDLALNYTSGQRAVISFEKGAAGTQALQNAFAQWQQ